MGKGLVVPSRLFPKAGGDRFFFQAVFSARCVGLLPPSCYLPTTCPKTKRMSEKKEDEMERRLRSLEQKLVIQQDAEVISLRAEILKLWFQIHCEGKHFWQWLSSSSTFCLRRNFGALLTSNLRGQQPLIPTCRNRQDSYSPPTATPIPTQT